MLKNHKLSKFVLSALLLASCFSHAKLIEDVQGNKIEIPDNVERIANLWHANNQVVLTLGGADKLVATTTNIQKSAWFNQVYPRIKDVPALTNGQDIQLESLLGLKPDVVLTSSTAIKEQVQQAGLPAVLVSFQDFDGLRNSVRITAEVIGDNAPQIAEKYIQELDENILFVTSRLKDFTDNKRPTVLHIASANNLLRIDGGKSMIGDWIEKAGGKNVLPEQANLTEVTMEEIIKANPDVIIVGNNNKADGIAQIKQDPAWQSISAVKNGRLYANPLGTFPWDRYSTEEALQVLWAAKTLHPDLFEDLDMKAETKAFYQTYFHYDLSDELAEKILAGKNPN